jgi:c-di-GMP-binding flagellar brake protein YcgR
MSTATLAKPAAAANQPVLPGQVQRRTTPRLMVNWHTRIMVDAPRFIEASVIDISEGGVGIHCDQRVRENQVYEFAVSVPNFIEWDRHQAIQFKGVVQSVVLSGDKFRLGVQFVSISPPAKSLIMAWLAGAGQRLLAAA